MPAGLARGRSAIEPRASGSATQGRVLPGTTTSTARHPARGSNGLGWTFPSQMTSHSAGGPGRWCWPVMGPPWGQDRVRWKLVHHQAKWQAPARGALIVPDCTIRVLGAVPERWIPDPAR
jgi:hypothetical protein